MLILNAIHRIGTLARANLTHKLDSQDLLFPHVHAILIIRRKK
ncbi:hypothetical protein ACS0PU_011580 [Formica fusca]